MRVRIIFGLNNRGSAVPFHHQYLLSDFFGSMIDSLPEPLRSHRMYNFSGIKGQTKVGKGGLHYFSSKITIVFGSPNQEFVNAVLGKIFDLKDVNIGNLNLSPEFVEREHDPDYQDAIKYICISPLVLSGPYTEVGAMKEFISPFDDAFSDFLYESTMARMEESGLFNSDDIASFFKFQIVPDKVYLAKIQDNAKKFSRIYTADHNGQKKEIRGYTLPLTLYADPKVQEFVFNCGFGEFAPRGFGMLDVANTNPLGRSEPYTF